MVLWIHILGADLEDTWVIRLHGRKNSTKVKIMAEHYLAAAAGFFTDSGSVFGILIVNSVP